MYETTKQLNIDLILIELTVYVVHYYLFFDIA